MSRDISAVAERYTAFGRKDWSPIVDAIRRFAKGARTAIVATVSGDANLHFFRELARQRITADVIPVMSLSINEAELPALARSNIAGHYVAWNYLHALDRSENHAFIAEWRRFTGDPGAVTNDPMEATWIGFHLWAAAVEAAGTTDIDKVRAALAGRRMAAPSGFTVWVDGDTQHLHKPVMIGRIGNDGGIEPVSISAGLVAPEPWSPWLAPERAAPLHEVAG